MSTKSPFEQAAANAANLATKPDQDTLLRLYGLYKQATVVRFPRCSSFISN